MKILIIFVARLQFIKFWSVSRMLKMLKEKGESINKTIVHTGKYFHKNMSEVFFEELNLPKLDYYLM